jgi:hypothetical protein
MFLSVVFPRDRRESTGFAGYLSVASPYQMWNSGDPSIGHNTRKWWMRSLQTSAAPHTSR